VDLAVCSRITAAFALVGSAAACSAAWPWAPTARRSTTASGGFNSFDAALASGGVFYVLTWRSGLFAVACAVFTALLFGAIVSLFTPWGLPALTRPFCFGTLAFTVMKRTSSRLVRGEVEGITTPEEHLKRMRGERGSGPGRDAVGSADSDLPRPP
jgi:urea transporter